MDEGGFRLLDLEIVKFILLFHAEFSWNVFMFKSIFFVHGTDFFFFFFEISLRFNFFL